MKKIGVLETLAPRIKRMKFSGVWINYSPFLNTDALVFGKTYEAVLVREHNGWYIDEIKEAPAGEE